MGATFKVYLPLIDETASDAEQDSARGLEQYAGKETILVVEDDDRVRQFVRRALERGGYTVLEAPNAGEALLIFEMHQGPIDLMITDDIMPRMTGPRLVARLRAVRPSLRVIYFSGYSEDRLETVDGAPNDAFLAKPVAVESLLACVRQVLDR